MKRIVAVAAFAVMCGSALAQDKGPAPQTGMDHPEVTKGARENGAMDTTGANTRAGKKDASRGAPKKGDIRK